MMDITRGGSAHRYIALGLSLLLLYMFVFCITSLHDHGLQAQARYEQVLGQLQKYQQLTASIDVVKLEHQQLLAEIEQDDRYLNEATASLAAAGLQKRLHLMIQSSGASLVSMDAIKTGRKNRFSPVTMKLHVRLNHQALLALLYELETQQPTGFINNIQVQRNISSPNQSLLEANLEYTVFMVTDDAA